MKRQRDIIRIVHLIIAALIGTYVYAPPAVADPLQPVLAFAGIPIALITGLFLYRPRWLPGNKPRGRHARGSVAEGA